MTEHDPEQEAVRRLLGEVPPAGPVPDAVAARLDARLAELVAEREAAAPSPVAETGDDELAQARRRRRFRTVLVAAASVSVLGLGFGTVLDDLSGGSGSSESVTAADSGDSGDAGGARELPESPEAAGPDASGEGGGSGSPRVEADSARAVPRPEVRRATLEADVTRIADQESTFGAEGEGAAARLLEPCAAPKLGPRDRVVPIRFEGDDATLVVRARKGGARDAEIYACDARGGPIATAALPPG